MDTVRRNRIQWTTAQINRVVELAKDHLISEIADILNAEFEGLNIERNHVETLMYKLGIKSGLSRTESIIRGKRLKGENRSIWYNTELMEYTKHINKGRTSQEVADLLSQDPRFAKYCITPSMIRCWRRNHHQPSGIDTKFKKGQASFNKGKPMPADLYERLKPTFFKKGSFPVATAPLWSIRQIEDGYLEIKFTDKVRGRKAWQLLHRYTWEQWYGPIPKGYCVTFRDGDKHNCSIDNLTLVSKAVNARLNHKRVRHLRDASPELKDKLITICKLQQAIYDKEKEIKANGKNNRERSSTDY